MTKHVPHFDHVDTWVFDLDNTLYPRHCDLFSQIDVRMTTFVSELTGLERTEARKLQKDLYRDYGTTLRGLMEIHDIDPHAFLDAAHDIDYSILPQNAELTEVLTSLPGRLLIYTNGSVAHAENTLKAMGVDPAIFEAIFDIVASDFEPKPDNKPFEKFLASYNVNGSTAAMFEDLPRNLIPAKACGMKTVLITPQDPHKFTAEAWEIVENQSEHIDFDTDDLDGFLGAIVGR